MIEVGFQSFIPKKFVLKNKIHISQPSSELYALVHKVYNKISRVCI